MSRSYSQIHLRAPSGMVDASVAPHLKKGYEAYFLAQTNSESIAQLKEQLNTAEEKIMNLSRCLNGKKPLERDDLSFIAIERRVQSIEERLPTNSFIRQVDKALAESEERIQSLITGQRNPKIVEDLKMTILNLISEEEKVIKEALQHAWTAEQTCAKLAEDNLSRIQECEKTVKNFIKYQKNLGGGELNKKIEEVARICQRMDDESYDIRKRVEKTEASLGEERLSTDWSTTFKRKELISALSDPHKSPRYGIFDTVEERDRKTKLRKKPAKSNRKGKVSQNIKGK